MRSDFDVCAVAAFVSNKPQRSDIADVSRASGRARTHGGEANTRATTTTEATSSTALGHGWSFKAAQPTTIASIASDDEHRVHQGRARRPV